jgi:ribosomal protein S18 acetylase RimI-like enzyme
MSEIRELAAVPELEASIPLIREAFATVAAEFNITPENNPTHASFMTLERLMERRQKAAYFGLFEGARQAGFVAAEKGPEGVYYIEMLAVPPAGRHRGYGRALVSHVLDYAARQGAVRVGLGMIDSHTILKKWYKSLGFLETGTKKFDRLPFLVCFMEKELSAQQVE